MSAIEQASLNVSDISRILARMQGQGAFDTDPSRTRYRASEVRSKLVKLEDEMKSLKMELLVLESLLAELPKNGAQAKAASTAAQKKSPKVSKAAAKPELSPEPTKGSPLGHRPKQQQLSPKKRAERAAKVLAAARSVVKRDGPQITSAMVAQHLIDSKIDMGVPGDRISTAVGNIIFRAKDEFEWVRNGTYRHIGKGVNGHHANA